MQAGDVFLTHGSGFVDSAIRFVERRKFSSSGSAWNHAGIVISADGHTVEMQAKGAVIGQINRYPDHKILPIQLTDVQRSLVVEYAVAALDGNNGRPVRYGWLTDLSIALDILTPARIEIRKVDTLICSQLAALALFHAGVQMPVFDFGRVTPAHLSSWFLNGNNQAR